MANEGNLIPFEKGDKRINRKGRPRNFDALRELAREIGYEPADIRNDGEVMTRIEAILRDWLASKNYHKQLAVMQYAFGKVPDKLEIDEHRRRVIIEWQEPNECTPKGQGPIFEENAFGQEVLTDNTDEGNDPEG